MYLGQCVEKAPTKTLFQNPLHPYTKALLRAIPAASISGRGKQLEVLKGEVTSPINMKPGCRFKARCSMATDDCAGCDIPLMEIEKDHFVACRFVKAQETKQ
jgi:oligopeptide/dipeptide ABC transporter ATP-binding protein